MEAYIIVNTEPTKVWKALESIKQVEGVKQCHVVAGRYDAIAYVEFQKIEDLGKTIIDIQNIEGITQTQTLLVIPPALRDENSDG
jgi:DNA-binding Lrp family transcriptional regulator